MKNFIRQLSQKSIPKLKTKCSSKSFLGYLKSRYTTPRAQVSLLQHREPKENIFKSVFKKSKYMKKTGPKEIKTQTIRERKTVHYKSYLYYIQGVDNKDD